MRYYLLYSLCLLLLSRSFAITEGEISLKHSEENYVAIHGSSNVNEFKLYNNSPFIADVHSKPDYHIIKMEVDEFTADNERMVKDFQQLINASKYPSIKIAVQKRKWADFEETSGLTNFKTRVTLSGVTKKYNVPCELTNQLDGGYTIEGKLAVKLTEFKLEPPVKLLGLVKVKNTVFVNFVFHFESEKSLTEGNNVEVQH